MKVDSTRAATRTAQRTLNAFSDALRLLLSESSFEELTVCRICKQAGYPRATFYNYFDNKEDLLHACWGRWLQGLRPETGAELSLMDTAQHTLDRLIDFLEENRATVENIVSRAAAGDALTRGFLVFLDERIRTLLREPPARVSSPIPRRLRIEHGGSTLLLLARHVCLGEERISRKAAHEYLTLLLGPILTEG